MARSVLERDVEGWWRIRKGVRLQPERYRTKSDAMTALRAIVKQRLHLDTKGAS